MEVLMLNGIILDFKFPLTGGFQEGKWVKLQSVTDKGI
jgi:hypothetical protein